MEKEDLLKKIMGPQYYNELTKERNRMRDMASSSEFKEVTIESFWGAIATVLLYQLFGFIVFQAFLSYISVPIFLFFGGLWIFVFMIADAVTLKKIRKYLDNEFTISPVQSLKQIDDFLKFCVTLVFAVILVLFFLGYYPFPRYDYNIFTLFAYYLFCWVISYGISRLLKQSPSSILISKNRTGLLFGLVVGGVFILVSYFIAKEMFYLHGMIGIGVCILIISSFLLEDQIKTVRKN
jgi:hypothetical protein